MRLEKLNLPQLARIVGRECDLDLPSLGERKVAMATQMYRMSVNAIEKRLKAQTCELCGTAESDYNTVFRKN